MLSVKFQKGHKKGKKRKEKKIARYTEDQTKI